MRILLVGGGTAGHLIPISAVISEIKKITQEKNLEKPEFLLISDSNQFKEYLIGAEIPCKFIKAAKLRRYWSLKNFIDFFKIPISIVQSLWHVFWYMPDVVFSKGGYVALPVVFVSWLYRIPVIIHESDIEPGVSNRISLRFVQKIAVSFKETQKYFPSDKVVLTGNPIRETILKGDKNRAQEIFKLNPEKQTVFIIGGSQGARRLNEILFEILPEILGKCQVIHQCGIKNYNEAKKRIERMNLPQISDYHLFPFLKESMKDAYAAADVIVSRAGANALAEIMALGKPSILIPLPNAAQDHQTKNAFYFSQRGAAILMEEPNLQVHILKGKILGLLDDNLWRMRISRVALSLARPDAARKVAEEVLRLAKVLE